MKRRSLGFVILITFVSTIFSVPIQANTDLVIQSDITPEYIAYLGEKEVTWLAQVVIGGDDTETMKAHMGLAILAFAWSHVDGDTFNADIEPLFENIEDNFNSFEDQIESKIEPLFEQSEGITDFVDQLTDFFISGDYTAFRDSMENIHDEIDWDFNELETLFDDWFETLDDNFSEENFEEHLNAIQEGTADFEFSVQVVGSEYEDDLFVFSREFFDRLDTLDDIGREMDENFGDGFDWLDSVMTETGGDVMPGIASIRSGLDNMTSFIDTLKTFLTDDPLAPFDIDVSDLDSLRENVVAEADTMFGGKVYDIDPEEEGKTIKPLAIIQNLPDFGIWDLFKDFYLSSDPANYTFGGIFPDGLTTEILDFIEADAILNDWDDEDDFYDHLLDLKDGWLLDIQADPEDPDAHMGVALVLMYEMVHDHEEIFEDVFRLLGEGRIDSLDYYYDKEDIDLSNEISEIGDHVDFYVDADESKHLNILVKTEEDAFGPYEIGTGSEYEIIHVSITGIRVMRKLLTSIGETLNEIVSGIQSFFDEINEIFIVDLDPSVLDFSQVDSDTALILMLEESNPDFLTVTPYGVDWFHDMGDQLEEGFEEMAQFYDQMVDLAEAMLPYEEDFGIDGNLFIEDMEAAADFNWEIWEDFAFPDSVTMVDEQWVNFSAWFDHPPESFLMMWKDFVFGIDETLGGLFPEGPLNVGPDIPVFLPKKLALYPNYPNPFNPSTRIAFDLPESGEVSLIIYNVRGEVVTHLVNDYMEAGSQVLYWDAHGLSSGIYIGRLEHSGRFLSNKMILLK